MGLNGSTCNHGSFTFLSFNTVGWEIFVSHVFYDFIGPTPFLAKLRIGRTAIRKTQNTHCKRLPNIYLLHVSLLDNKVKVNVYQYFYVYMSFVVQI